MERKPTILVVEDEESILRKLEQQLNDAGYHIITASNGEQALECIKTMSFDLILLDIVMPKKNGFEVLHELRMVNHPTPVIVASSLGHEDDITHAMSLGAREYFLKATHFPNIVSHIDRVLRKKRMTGKKSPMVRKAR